MIKIKHLKFESAKSLMTMIFDAVDVSMTNCYLLDAMPEDGVTTECGVNFTLASVYEEGGGEGKGEYVERVYSVLADGKHALFVRDTGFYESYNGTEMNGDWEEVFPQEVTVIRYAKEGETATV